MRRHVDSVLQAAVGRVAIVMARVSALMVFAPFFASATIAPRIKAGLTVALTALLYPAVAAELPVLSRANAWKVVAGEIVAGLLMGLALQFVFEGVQLAGQVAGFQVGHTLANLINPLSDAETPVLANFQQAVVVLIFLQLNVHHWVLRALGESFRFCPPGRMTVSPTLAAEVWRASGAILVTAVEIALPTLLATIMIDLTLGLLGRASPQLPVLFVGISVKTVAAFLAVMGALRFWPGLFEKYFVAALVSGERFLHLAQ